MSVASTRTTELPERGNGTDEAVDDDSLNEVIMAINMRDRGTVGCAYYVAAEEKLYFMEDIHLGGPEIVEACKLYPLLLTQLAC